MVISTIGIEDDSREICSDLLHLGEFGRENRIDAVQRIMNIRHAVQDRWNADWFSVNRPKIQRSKGNRRSHRRADALIAPSSPTAGDDQADA